MGEPFAASRVCDERSGKRRRTALDSAPGSHRITGYVSLDKADAVIDATTAAKTYHYLLAGSGVIWFWSGRERAKVP